MADGGLGVVASTVSIAAAALQSVQFLLKTIENVKDAPDTIKSIDVDLKAVELVLCRLNGEMQCDNPQVIFGSVITPAIENCRDACTSLQRLLDHWTGRSTEEPTFGRMKWTTIIFGLDKIKSYKQRFSDCKSTLSVALSTTTILSIVRQEYMVQEMKDTMLQHNKDDLQRKIVQADTMKHAIETSVRQLSISANTQPSENTEQDRQKMLHELRQQQASNESLRKTCEEALLRTVSAQTKQKIKGVKATNSSAALTGFVNATEEETKIDQDISDVTADNWSCAVGGVIRNVDFGNWRPPAPSPRTEYRDQ